MDRYTASCWAGIVIRPLIILPTLFVSHTFVRAVSAAVCSSVLVACLVGCWSLLLEGNASAMIRDRNTRFFSSWTGSCASQVRVIAFSVDCSELCGPVDSTLRDWLSGVHFASFGSVEQFRESEAPSARPLIHSRDELPLPPDQPSYAEFDLRLSQVPSVATCLILGGVHFHLLRLVGCCLLRVCFVLQLNAQTTTYLSESM